MARRADAHRRDAARSGGAPPRSARRLAWGIAGTAAVAALVVTLVLVETSPTDAAGSARVLEPVAVAEVQLAAVRGADAPAVRAAPADVIGAPAPIASAADVDAASGSPPDADEAAATCEFGRVVGRVTNCGRPVPGVEVRAIEGPVEPEHPRVATTGPDGAYSIMLGSPGAWLLDVRPPDAPEDMPPVLQEWVRVEMGAMAAHDLDLVGGVAVRVVDAGTREPLPGGDVRLVGADGRRFTSDVDVGGVAHFPFAWGGSWIAEVDGRGEWSPSRSELVHADGACVATITLPVARRGGLEILGTSPWSDGGEVWLRRDGRWVLSVRVQRDRVAVEGLDPDEYEVHMLREPSDRATSRGVTAQVQAGATTTLVAPSW